jgi:hypothetical protein
MSEGWSSLITARWNLPAGGADRYRCARKTVAEDLYVRGFRSVSPPGTHHTVLGVDAASGPDGELDCAAFTLAHRMLFASGVGTDELVLPEGVAIKIPAGTQLLINLHLFNAGDAALEGASGTEVLTVPASEVEQEAELVLAGRIGFSIPASPPGAAPTPFTVTGGCRFARQQTVVTVWPHMHQIGIHMKVTHEPSGAVWSDAPYSFDEQVNYTIPPTLVDGGDLVRVDCTYLNDTGQPVPFGDSSEQEMCFAGLYRYPAAGLGGFCVNES